MSKWLELVYSTVPLESVKQFLYCHFGRISEDNDVLFFSRSKTPQSAPPQSAALLYITLLCPIWYIQLWPFAIRWLLNKPYVNEVILSWKFCQSLEIVIYIGKGFRSFHTGNTGSVHQRSQKLLAFKFGGLKKKSANSTITAEMCASASALVSIGQGSSRTKSISFSKFFGQ